MERAELDVLRGVEARHWPAIAAVAAEVHAACLPEVLAMLRGPGGYGSVVAAQPAGLAGTSLWAVWACRP